MGRRLVLLNTAHPRLAGRPPRKRLNLDVVPRFLGVATGVCCSTALSFGLLEDIFVSTRKCVYPPSRALGNCSHWGERAYRVGGLNPAWNANHTLDFYFLTHQIQKPLWHQLLTLLTLTAEVPRFSLFFLLFSPFPNMVELTAEL